MKKISLLSLMLCLSCNVFCQSLTPQAPVEGFLDTIRSMVFPVADAAHQADLVKKAGSFVDLNAVGQRAVAEHWAQATEEQQKKFLELFSKLIEKTAYPRSHDFLGNLKIAYSAAEADATGTAIKSVVHDPSQGLDTAVVYHLVQKDGQWIVDDVVLDDVSIVEDLKYQFDKLVKDSNFAGLLAKMQERLDQVDKPAAPVAS